MEIFSEKFIKSEELEKRIRTTCSFNNAKCEFRQGRILYIGGTNISFIELILKKIILSISSIFIFIY